MLLPTECEERLLGRKQEALQVAPNVHRAALKGHLRPIGRDVLLDRRVLLEPAPPLIEVRELRVLAGDDFAMRGLQLTEERAEQRGLARAIRSDDADLVAARNIDRRATTDRSSRVSVR